MYPAAQRRRRGEQSQGGAFSKLWSDPSGLYSLLSPLLLSLLLLSMLFLLCCFNLYLSAVSTVFCILTKAAYLVCSKLTLLSVVSTSNGLSPLL